MNDQSNYLPTSYMIGEIRRPRIYKRKNDDNISCFSFILELLSQSCTSRIFYVDNCCLDRISGEYKANAIFDKLSNFKHGSKVILEVTHAVIVKGDRLFINDYVNGVYPFTEQIANSLIRVGVSLE